MIRNNPDSVEISWLRNQIQMSYIERVAAVELHHETLSIQRQCELLGVDIEDVLKNSSRRDENVISLERFMPPSIETAEKINLRKKVMAKAKAGKVMRCLGVTPPVLKIKQLLPTTVS